MRQTEFGRDELLKSLIEGDPLPRCLCANELGIICCQDDDEEVEGVLRELLQNSLEDKKLKYVAFCSLSSKDEISPETAGALDDFREDPANIELVEQSIIDIPRAKEQLWAS